MFNQISTIYLEKSLVVIPLNGKIPAIKNWQNMKLDSPEINTDYLFCGTGILLGKVNKIVAIDIDKEEAKKLCPPSPLVKKGKKGETRFFKYNGEPAIKRHDLGIELLSDGNHTVLPPSNHPETRKPYLWLSQDTLEDFDIDDLPIIPNDFIQMLKNNNEKKQCEGRHNTLVSMMGTCISQFMTKEQSVRHCFEYDQINHTPPYFSDQSEMHKGKGIPVAASMYESVKQTAINCGEFIDPDELNKVHISLDFLDKKVQLKPKRFVKLPKLVGIGQLLFEDIYNNSHVPRSQFAFMSAIQIMSHIIGNRISFMGNCANLYQYGLAPSGFGKDFPYRRVLDYLNAVDKRILASNSPTSESVVLIQIERNREKLFVVNEAESLMKRMMNDNSNHGLKECLTDMYDMPMKLLNSKTVLSGKGKSTEQYEAVFSPYVGMYLMSTQTGFEENVNDNVFNTGFMSRFLIYFEDRFKRAVNNPERKLSPDNKIIQGLKYIYDHGKPKIADLSDLKSPPQVYDLTPTLEAQSFYTELFEALEDDKEKSYGKTRFMGLLGRKMQFINKFAIIHHVMKNNVNYHNKLEKDSLIWANAAVSAIINNMVINLDRHVYSSQHQKLLNKVLEKVRSVGSKGYTKAEVLRYCHISAKQRNSIIPELIEIEQIYYCDKSKKFYATEH